MAGANYLFRFSGGEIFEVVKQIISDQGILGYLYFHLCTGFVFFYPPLAVPVYRQREKRENLLKFPVKGLLDIRQNPKSIVSHPEPSLSLLSCVDLRNSPLFRLDDLVWTNVLMCVYVELSVCCIMPHKPLISF